MSGKARTDLQLLEYLEGYLTPQRRERFRQVLSRRTRYLTVALEDVYQMHNASAVIRSCEVFGIQDAHLIEGRFGRRLDKRIAMGAQQWVDVHRYDDNVACLNALKAKGYRIVATTPREGSCPLDAYPLNAPVALFFGTEKEGLSAEVLEQAEEAIHIPMHGFTESLNISVAAAIILQDLSDRLHRSDIPWQLSDQEIEEKRFDWACKSIRGVSEIIERYSNQFNPPFS